VRQTIFTSTKSYIFDLGQLFSNRKLRWVGQSFWDRKSTKFTLCFEHRFFDEIHKAEEKVGFGHQPTCATLAKRYRAKVRLLLESSNASMENPATVPATNLSPPPNNLSCSKIIEANSYHMFHVIEPGNTQQLYIGVDWRIKFPFVLGSTWGHK
jgi:hypothetical protein